MVFAARSRWFHSGLLALLVALGSFGSGCQSSRPGFSFQPAPGRVGPVQAAGTPAAAPAPATLPIAATQAKSAAYPPAAPATVFRQPQQRQQQPRPELVGFLAEKAISLPTLHPAAPHQRPLLHRPHGPAEAGLGTTVLGVLGLVTLSIALLGLLLSGGGLGWGIVAGAAALAVLVAYLDPDGRR